VWSGNKESVKNWVAESVIPNKYRQHGTILYSQLRFGLPSILISLGFPVKILYASLFSPMRATYPVHLSYLDSINLISNKLCSFLSCNFLQISLTCSLSSQNISLSNPVWNVVKVCSSYNVKAQVLYPYKTNETELFSVHSNFYIFRFHSLASKYSPNFIWS
jgi:hypothetical protein